MPRRDGTGPYGGGGRLTGRGLGGCKPPKKPTPPKKPK